MTSTAHLTKIQNWIGNKAIFEIIMDRDKIETVVKDIESRYGGVNIEILQFVTTYSLYENLDRKRRAFIADISRTDDIQQRLSISEKLVAIEKEQSDFIKNILHTAHTFTAIKLEGILERVAEVFFQGDIDRANEILNPEVLTKEQTKLLQYIQERVKVEHAYDKLEDNANEFRVKAQITILNLDILNPDDRLQKAIFFFQRGQSSAKATRRASFIGIFSFGHGYFLNTHTLYQEAAKLYEESLQINRQLAEVNPQTYLPGVAMVLHNLATLYHALNKFIQALPLYEEALQIYRQLAEVNPETHLPHMSVMLNSLATLYQALNEFIQALPLFEEALQIRRRLAEVTPQTYLPNLAVTLNNLAILYSVRNEFIQALPLFEEALQIRRQLAEVTPQTYLPDLAETLNNLALLYSDRNEFIQAQTLYEESLQIRRQLADVNPQTYLPGVATTLNNLANLYSDRNEFIQQAQTLYEESLQIRRQLADVNPEANLPYVGVTLNNLANLHQARNEFIRALPQYEESLQIRRQLAKVNPQTYLPDVAGTLNNLAAMFSARNEFIQALPLFEESLQIIRQLAEVNPQTYLPDVARIEVNMSLFYLQKIPNKEQSLAFAKEALNTAKTFGKDIELSKDIISNAKMIIAAWGQNHLNYDSVTTIAPSIIDSTILSKKKRIEDDSQLFALENFRKFLDKIRAKIEKNNVESALLDCESFIAAFEKINPDDKEGELDFLAEAKLLLGICYGKRAGSIISVPERQQLTEAHELAKSLLVSGDSVSELYLESVMQRINSLKKETKGWFPSKTSKKEIVFLQNEVISLLERKILSNDAKVLFSTIKDIKI